MSQDTLHPAAQANMRSIEHATAGNREAWLSLYADDAVLADPVGVSPLDPGGEGHRGKAAIARFWDTVIGPASLQMTVHRRCPSGDHTCAVSMTVQNDLGNGLRTEIDMIAIYEVNEQGKIASMKAYWSWDDLAAQLAPPGSG